MKKLIFLLAISLYSCTQESSPNEHETTLSEDQEVSIAAFCNSLNTFYNTLSPLSSEIKTRSYKDSLMVTGKEQEIIIPLERQRTLFISSSCASGIVSSHSN